ncbi:MAG: C-terminal binding protein [Proteobacteria bacterium]|nr:C-terminal binding protein [Pseudomonadota bacterium]
MEIFSELDATVTLAENSTPEAIIEAARDADALMVTFAQITSEVIGKLKNCRAIGRFGIGVDNIDIDAATKAGIQVCYVPDYCLDEVSDHALALLMSLARKITYSNALVQSGRWEGKAAAPLWRLRGRTLGLVGLGKIPQTLTPKAKALGLNVVAYDPYVSKDVAAALDVQLLSFDELLATSDYISLHAPLTKETTNLFDADAFAKTKPEALLINTARGPIIDEQAMANALDAGRISGAGLDVMPNEPPSADCPLLNRDNVILTPHTAYYSEDALFDLQTKAARDVVSVLSGEAPVYPFNQLI